MSKTQRIKQMTEMVKGMAQHNLLRRIPNPAPRPLDKTKEVQDAFDKIDNRRLDKSTIRFFCDPFTWDDGRRLSE